MNKIFIFLMLAILVASIRRALNISNDQSEVVQVLPVVEDSICKDTPPTSELQLYLDDTLVIAYKNDSIVGYFKVHDGNVVRVMTE